MRRRSQTSVWVLEKLLGWAVVEKAVEAERELPGKCNEKDHNKHKYEQLRVSEGGKSIIGVPKAESQAYFSSWKL
ncbi:hypothetical protein OIDMADRAFT_19888 [Oidiodendron maius Zn]|uniref:Uncharacterized protein n=1 Tax=Oidiodendron maius (strain Zn) TaxID=913774 RepID=A0A0C3CIN1_OIDMZ|nr:hypothetical protein OIDMADRAFT_19888 [Oidiodendron maius Zn]